MRDTGRRYTHGICQIAERRRFIAVSPEQQHGLMERFVPVKGQGTAEHPGSAQPIAAFRIREFLIARAEPLQAI